MNVLRAGSVWHAETRDRDLVLGRGETVFRYHVDSGRIAFVIHKDNCADISGETEAERCLPRLYSDDRHDMTAPDVGSYLSGRGPKSRQEAVSNCVGEAIIAREAVKPVKCRPRHELMESDQHVAGVGWHGVAISCRPSQSTVNFPPNMVPFVLHPEVGTARYRIDPCAILVPAYVSAVAPGDRCGSRRRAAVAGKRVRAIATARICKDVDDVAPLTTFIVCGEHDLSYQMIIDMLDDEVHALHGVFISASPLLVEVADLRERRERPILGVGDGDRKSQDEQCSEHCYKKNSLLHSVTPCDFSIVTW